LEDGIPGRSLVAAIFITPFEQLPSPSSLSLCSFYEQTATFHASAQILPGSLFLKKTINFDALVLSRLSRQLLQTGHFPLSQ
jgi:hypothetical protein